MTLDLFDKIVLYTYVKNYKHFEKRNVSTSEEKNFLRPLYKKLFLAIFQKIRTFVQNGVYLDLFQKIVFGHISRNINI